MTVARRNLVIKLQRKGHPEVVTPVRGRTVTMGHNWKCHVVDPGSSKGKARLLVRSLSGTRIHLPPDARGTFTYRGSTLSLEDMALWGLLVKTRAGYRVAYRPGMSARIETGGATLVFEPTETTVQEPMVEAVPAGHLPARYRVLIPHSSDFTFFALFAVILACQIMAVRALHRYPIPDITTLRELPRRISRLILEPVAPPPSPLVKAGEKGGAGTEDKAGELKQVEEAPAEQRPAEAPPASEAAAPATREAVRSQVSRMGVLGVLTGRGTAGRAAAGKGISVLQLDTELQQDLDKVLGEISGISTVAASAGTGPGVGQDGPGSRGGLIGIDEQLSGSGVTGPVQVSSIGKVPGAPEGIGEEAGGRPVAGSEEEYIPPDQREERSNRAIARIVAAHTGAIRYAYNRELRKNPSLRGKIVLTFTISPDGQVTECRVEESAMGWPPLEESLVRMVRTWKFPEIPEGEVTVSYPLVFFPSM